MFRTVSRKKFCKMRQALPIRAIRKSSFELLLRFGRPVNVASDTMTGGGSESMPAEVRPNPLQQRYRVSATYPYPEPLQALYRHLCTQRAELGFAHPATNRARRNDMSKRSAKGRCPVSACPCRRVQNDATTGLRRIGFSPRPCPTPSAPDRGKVQSNILPQRVWTQPLCRRYRRTKIALGLI